METPHAPVPGAEIPEQELTPAHPQWPKSWRHLNDPPDRIHVRGNSEVLNRPVLAMVGTRRATNRGLAVARSLAAGLAAQGWVVASGLAGLLYGGVGGLILGKAFPKSLNDYTT